MRAHDGQRPAHRHLLVAAEMDERARRRRACALRSLERQHELIACEALLREDLGALLEDRAAMGSRLGIHWKWRRDWTLRAMVASTAMRTATPFATCRWITDCGPSATSLAISTSRFIGPGCITIA